MTWRALYRALLLSALLVGSVAAVEPTASARALDVAEYFAKLFGSLLGIGTFLGLFVAKVWKPYTTWRRTQLAAVMRDVLKTELDQLHTLIHTEDDCTQQMLVVMGQLRELFSEHDMLLTVVLDNRDRHDETNELLDELGFSSDRRSGDDERTRAIDDMLAKLHGQRKQRRRAGDNPRPIDPHESALQRAVRRGSEIKLPPDQEPAT